MRFGAPESFLIMARSPEKLYEFHVANLRMVDDSLERVARSLRSAIRVDDEKTVESLTRIYALLLGAWAECRLRKLLFEPGGFNEVARESIRSQNTQFERWHHAVERAFRNHYNVSQASLSDVTLPHSAYSRYTSILELLENHLRPIIELRNKLAHGQWVYPLNSNGDNVSQEHIDALRKENILSLQFKKSLLSSLSHLVHDLVVSLPTFQQDFDKHFRHIVQTRENLENRSYQWYVAQLRQKYERGKKKRAQAMSASKET